MGEPPNQPKFNPLSIKNQWLLGIPYFKKPHIPSGNLT